MTDEPTTAVPQEPRAKFCPECGTPTAGAKFCPECGHPTGIAAAATSRSEPSPETVHGDELEKEVWQGSPDPFFSPVDAKATTYTLTTQRLRVDSGVVARKHAQMELFRVKDVEIRRNLKHRARGRGDLIVVSTDPSLPVLRLEAIASPDEVAEMIRELVVSARKRSGIVARELM